MKIRLGFILLIFPTLSFSQTDSISLDEAKKLIELEEVIGKPPECRVVYENDSLLKIAAKCDAEESISSTIKKYYRIGEASGIFPNESQIIAINKYQLLIEYTHCRPCKYQVEYNKVFKELYLKEYKKDINDLINEIEREAPRVAKKKFKNKN